MTLRNSRTTLAVAFLALLSWGSLTTARAQGCSVSETAGRWGFSTNGTVVGIGPRVSLGIFTLDIAGNLQHGKATSSLNGSVTDEVFSGTYTVNSDCTGKLSIDVFDTSGNKLFTATLDLVFDQGSNEMRAIYTSAVTAGGIALAPVIVVDAKRIGEP